MDIINWLLENIFTFNPITSISLWSLFGLYFLYGMVSLLIASPFLYLGRKEKVETKLSLKGILVSVPIEDALFRFLPLCFIGQQAAIYAHFIWALLHRRIPTIIWVVIHGLLDLRLWLGGLWIEAIFIHSFHDLVCFTIVSSLEKHSVIAA